MGVSSNNPIVYRMLVSILLYLTITRLDISFAVGVVSQFMQKPRRPHLDAVKHILRYLSHTSSFGLIYKRGADFILKGFVDADWAGDPST